MTAGLTLKAIALKKEKNGFCTEGSFDSGLWRCRESLRGISFRTTFHIGASPFTAVFAWLPSFARR